MDLKRDEIDLIFGYWKDISQDPEFISQDTEIDLDRVNKILQLLSDQRKIKDFIYNESKVLSFNELMDPELSIELGLPSFQKDIDDKDYFFDKKEVNKTWDKGVIKIYVYNVSFDGETLMFKTKITIYEDEFDIYIFFDDDENVEFGSEKDVDLDDFDLKIERFLKEEYFQDMFFDIYDEIIPDDFWETRSKIN
jgi:hypothetical protein